MNTADIVQCPPLDAIAKIAASKGKTVVEFTSLLIAASHAPEGVAIGRWLEAESIRHANARTRSETEAEWHRRRARGERG